VFNVTSITSSSASLRLARAIRRGDSCYLYYAAGTGAEPTFLLGMVILYGMPTALRKYFGH
jgi:hypothetical protein